MKKSNKIISMLLSVILVCSLLPVSQASAKRIENFPLKTSKGTLVADQTTKFVTVFEQDPISKMITATVQIEQGNTDEIAIELAGIGIFFDKARVAPYSFKSDTPAILFGRINTGTPGYKDEFAKYYDGLSGFTTESNQIIVRDMQNSGEGFISIMLNRPCDTDDSLPDPVKISPNGKAGIAKFYFMPVKDNDKDLDLNMFDYGYKRDTDTLIRISNFFGYGSTTAEPTEADLKLAYSDSIINQSSFKLHVMHTPPAVEPNNEKREVTGYDANTMEWSADGITFASGTPVVKDEAHTLYVRVKGDSDSGYSGNNAPYSNYKKYVAGVPAAVNFKASSCQGKIELKKTSVNNTSTDGKTHVNDELTYTITVNNTATHPSSVWVNAVMTDKLPEGVDFKGAVTLNNANLSTPGGYTFANGTLTVPLGNIPGGDSKVVTFKVTVSSDAYGKDITNSVTVAGKDGEDGEEFEEEADEEGDNHIVVAKSAAPVLDGITEGDRTVTGKGKPGATIEVEFPNGEKAQVKIPDGAGDQDVPWSLNVPDGIDLTGGNKVTATQIEKGKDPSSPVEKTVDSRPDANNEATKTAKNITTNDDSIRRVGDTLQYTITATNKGPAKSLWANVTIVDALPEEVDFKGNVKIGDDAAGTNAVYDAGTHTLTVNLGGIPGGTSKVVTFEVEINDKAYSKSFKNTATVGGIDIEEPGDPPIVVRRSVQPEVDTINEGDRKIEGDGVKGAKIEVSFPNSTLKATATVDEDGRWSVNVPLSVNLFEGDIVTVVQTEPGFDPSEPLLVDVFGKASVIPFMSKTAENQTSDDGKIHVKDEIKYTIVVRNDGAKSVWTGAVLKDTLREGVTFVAGSVNVNGTSVAYSFSGGVLSVPLGNIVSGEAGQKIVTFEVTVNPDAYGKDIKNSASVEGKANGGETDVKEDTEEEGEDFTVMEKSDEPTVDEITRGDDKITGGGVPGSDIIVKLPDGTEIKTTVNNDGSWTADLPSGKALDTGDKIYVIQIEKDKDPSEPVEKTVKDKPYRAIHGYVWPIVSEAPAGIVGFIEKHEIVVELRANANTPAEVLKTIAVTVESRKNDDIGEFTIENIPFGEYILYIKRPGYIARCMPVKIPSGDGDVIELVPPQSDDDDDGIFKLWWGDSNGDFRVDGRDISMILEKFNVSASSPEYDPDCDLNADGLIDGRDLALATSRVNLHARNYAGAEKIDFDAEPIKKP